MPHRRFASPLRGLSDPFNKGLTGSFSLETVHRTVFRALEPLKTLHWRVFQTLEPIEMGRQGGRRNAAPTRAYTKSRSSLISYRWAADLPALLSDAANERFILRKDCEAVGSLVPEIRRQKSAFPGSLPEAVSERRTEERLFLAACTQNP